MSAGALHYPKVSTLPAIAAPARWHQHAWTGVVLTSTDFLKHTPERESLMGFWREAFGMLWDLSTPA